MFLSRFSDSLSLSGSFCLSLHTRTLTHSGSGKSQYGRANKHQNQVVRKVVNQIKSYFLFLRIFLFFFLKGCLSCCPRWYISCGYQRICSALILCTSRVFCGACRYLYYFATLFDQGYNNMQCIYALYLFFCATTYASSRPLQRYNAKKKIENEWSWIPVIS